MYGVGKVNVVFAVGIGGVDTVQSCDRLLVGSRGLVPVRRVVQ